ncbi:hypothetical protein OGAPHI_007344 [Ogataea philodendri]|uniref:Uncharacterized protein n=1 Tax=Ogataea philodendri TaxID=1378263 RepID=A0A9P8SZI6_9ASCO|nr:uncharacterized protein OGAPHI_007344 [Ogataea philodendri]KAH3660139.1 hypothetical protein OGAPHI_007344 [Ogataea philodendri]
MSGPIELNSGSNELIMWSSSILKFSAFRSSIFCNEGSPTNVPADVPLPALVVVSVLFCASSLINVWIDFLLFILTFFMISLNLEFKSPDPLKR